MQIDMNADSAGIRCCFCTAALVFLRSVLYDKKIKEKEGERMTSRVDSVGLSGISANIYKCVQRSEELGFVGDVVEVNAAPVQAMLDAGYIPRGGPCGAPTGRAIASTSTATPPPVSWPAPWARRS